MAVVGFSPHAQGAGVFAKNSVFSHLIRRLGPVKEVVAWQMRQPDYNALSLSLSHGVRGWGYDIAPGGTTLSEFGARMCLAGKRPFVKAEEF